jgi:hypothetical protein
MGRIMQLNRSKEIRSMLVENLRYWQKRLDGDKENVEAILNCREYKEDIIKIDKEIARLKYK